jgi:hypothetical protein
MFYFHNLSSFSNRILNNKHLISNNSHRERRLRKPNSFLKDFLLESPKSKKRKRSFLENENLSEDDEDSEIEIQSEETWDPHQEPQKSRKVSGMLFIILIILNK